MSEQSPPPPPALSERVIYALLGPATQLAFAFRLPLKPLLELLQTAYFHETRRRGLTTAEAAELLDVSPRKIAMLSRDLKHSFLPEDREVGLPRRIEFMLWAEPLSAARLTQVLDAPTEAVEAAIAQLLAEGRIREEADRVTRYAVVRSEFRLVDQRGWLSRLDGLNNLLSSVTAAVKGRFFDDEPRAFARTLNFRAVPGWGERLRTLYESTIFPALAALDEEARGCPDAECVDLSVVWAPANKEMTEGEDE